MTTVQKKQLDAYFGEYGGMFVPELFVPALEQLEQAYLDAREDEAFLKEFWPPYTFNFVPKLNKGHKDENLPKA